MGIEIIFLFLMGLIWITFATVQDIKTREIANWLNFSLIIFALGFRFFYSLFNLENFNFFYQGIFGLILFFIIGNLFYKLKLFAGGDAKLMIALGTILPLNVSFFQNFYGFFYFLLLFLFAGSLYGLIMSIYLGIKNFKKLKKEFSKEFKKRRKLFILTTFLSLILIIFSFVGVVFFYFGIFLFSFPYLYFYVKSIDECCMVRSILPSKLTVGDWLYKDILVGKTKIKANWDGLTQREINLLKRKKKKVLVRYGIQFAPAFLIAFILFIVFKFLEFF